MIGNYSLITWLTHRLKAVAHQLMLGETERQWENGIAVIQSIVFYPQAGIFEILAVINMVVV